METDTVDVGSAGTEGEVATESEVEPQSDAVGTVEGSAGTSDAAPQTYKVKVGDAEQDVTLEDLQSGFMRQADYTRKTQEVAQMRQRLSQAEAIANALDADPEGTLRALGEAFGVTPQQAQAALDGDEGAEVDPVEARLQQMEAQFRAQNDAQVRSQIDSEIDTLVNTYGDFDLQATIAHAAQNGMTVTAAYRDLNFDSLVNKQKQSDQVLSAKRDASVVGGGSHRAGVVPGGGKPANSIREAWEQAKQALSA